MGEKNIDRVYEMRLWDSDGREWVRQDRIDDAAEVARLMQDHQIPVCTYRYRRLEWLSAEARHGWNARRIEECSAFRYASRESILLMLMVD